MVAKGKREREKKIGKNMQQKMLVEFALCVTNFLPRVHSKRKIIRA
jgi:hypothetical protein